MNDQQTAGVNRHDAHYIDGNWQPVAGGRALDLVDSFSGAPLASVSLGSAGDVDAAVSAARRAFQGWSETPVAKRAALLGKVAVQLADRADVLAAGITHEVGMPIKLSRRVQVDGPLREWKFYAEHGKDLELESRLGHSIVRKVPVGVVAAITPWNYPLNQITAKVAAALLAGCTVVLKPSELAPSSARIVAEALDAAGCPAGVFNMVLGEGPDVGEALISHPDIDMVSFTGSTAVGRHVAAVAAGQIKRIGLELGGKSACVVLDGADISVAVKTTLGGCFLNSGQTCNALTRLVVPRGAIAQVRELVAGGVGAFAMGDPMDGSTRLGPLITKKQRDRVAGLVAAAVAEGAEVLAGGPEASVPDSGWFVAPTVLLVDPAKSIASEEVFGPVLCVIPHDGEDDAVGIANGTPYGLAAAVWGKDADDAMRVARRLRAGQVDVQGAPFNGLAPFGGLGQSGIGREHGPAGLEEFFELQSLQIPA